MANKKIYIVISVESRTDIYDSFENYYHVFGDYINHYDTREEAEKHIESLELKPENIVTIIEGYTGHEK